MDLEESPERLAAYRSLAAEYPRRFAELLEKAHAEAGTAAQPRAVGGDRSASPGASPASERPIWAGGLMTVDEFADLSRLSTSTIYRLIRDRGIGFIRVSERICIPETEVVRLFGSWRQMMTVPELAAVLKVSTPTAYRRIATGDIEAVRIGGTIRVPESAVKPGRGHSPESSPAPSAVRRPGAQPPPLSKALFPAVRFRPSPFAWSEDDQHG